MDSMKPTLSVVRASATEPLQRVAALVVPEVDPAAAEKLRKYRPPYYHKDCGHMKAELFCIDADPETGETYGIYDVAYHDEYGDFCVISRRFAFVNGALTCIKEYPKREPDEAEYKKLREASRREAGVR